MKKVEENLIPH